MLSSFFFSHVSWCKREGGGERKRKQREDTWRTWSSVSSASVRGLLATFLRTISFPGEEEEGGGAGSIYFCIQDEPLVDCWDIKLYSCHGC